mgnify:CR=1 FL=1
MRWFYVRKNGNGKKIISVLLIVFLLGLILPESAKADNTVKSPQNYFYTMVIKNTLAAINPKGKTKDEVGIIKNPILSFLGVDFSDPVSIITKQIAYLNNNTSVDNEGNGVEKRETLVLNPFNLDDKQVTKLGDQVDASNAIATIYNPKLKQTLNKAKPRVLIYHSHTTESYLASANDKTTNTFNSDLTQGVCEVGTVIANDLIKNYGIEAINDDTIHNVGDYKASYKNSRVTLNKYLKKYGDFDIIIDLHRDGVEGVRKNETTKVNGVDVAKVMFVMVDTNPKYATQKKLVSSMIGISNKLYPGLMDYRQVYLYHHVYNYFSQDRSNNAMLIEVGSNTSTIAEAKNTGMYLSRIIAEQLNGKK